MKNNKTKSILKISVSIVLILAVIFFTALFAVEKAFPIKYKEDIIENSEKYGLDPYLIMAIIRTESNFREGAVSHADAIGLMQITDETGGHIAQNIGYEDYSTEILYDAKTNIQFGTWYISWLISQFGGNLKNALAAYNAGINKVKKWLADESYSSDGENLDMIPYTETENFVNRVNLYRDIYELVY